MFSKGMLREYSSILSIGVRLIDILCVLIGSLVAYSLQFNNLLTPTRYQIAILIALLLTVIIFSFSGLYRSWRGQSWIQQARVLIFRWISVLFILIMIGFLTKSGDTFSRVWIGLWFVSTNLEPAYPQ